jgi:hypothetical protein
MNIAGIDNFKYDSRWELHRSPLIAVPLLGSQQCQIVIEYYNDDPNTSDFDDAISAFLSLTKDTLAEAAPYVLDYYNDTARGSEIKDPNEVWSRVSLGNEPIFSRRPYGDEAVYVSIKCSCDWDEHGLQIVYKKGNALCKVGPFDGHLTNSDSYDDEALEHVIYHSVK